MVSKTFSEYELRKLFLKSATKQYKAGAEKYMKFHFTFLGVNATDRSRIIRQVSKELIGLSTSEVKSTLGAITSTEREFIFFKITILAQNLQIFNGGKNIALIRSILTEDSWWDSVDTISAKVLHPLLLELTPAERKVLLLKFSTDSDMWVRRAAIVSIVSMRGEIPKSINNSILINNLGTDEFFINKAIGWFLREEYFFDQKFVVEFARKHKLNRVAQREVDRAIKGLSQSGKPMKRAIKPI